MGKLSIFEAVGERSRVFGAWSACCLRCCDVMLVLANVVVDGMSSWKPLCWKLETLCTRRERQRRKGAIIVINLSLFLVNNVFLQRLDSSGVGNRTRVDAFREMHVLCTVHVQTKSTNIVWRGRPIGFGDDATTPDLMYWAYSTRTSTVETKPF